MSAKQVNGKDLMLFTESNSKFTTIALAKSCKLSVSGETLDIASKDSGKWTEKMMKKLSFSASSENCFSADDAINGYDALLTAMITMQPIKIKFGIASNADADELPKEGWLEPDTSYEGMVLITNVELNAPDGENATFSVSFEGTGALKKTTKTDVQSVSEQSGDQPVAELEVPQPKAAKTSK